MNPTDQSPDRPPHDDRIGDQNVERLVTDVYHPEPLDPEFVERVRQRAQSEVGRRQQGNVALPPRSAAARSATWWLLGAAALVVLMVAGYLVTRSNSARPARPGYYVDGELIWIDGQVYQPADQVGSRSAEGPDIPRDRAAMAAAEPPSPPRISGAGLTPRSRPTVTAQPVVAVGETIVTERGQRRRVRLPDGSVLYVNQQTTVQVQDDRRVVVSAGEVFVEVSPADNHDGAKFVVQTPNREVTAVGTKFAVHVTGSETDVAVAQGKVNVSGIKPMLLAGQQLRLPNHAGPTEAPITPLPRTSHVLHWTRELMAAAESPLVPGSDHRGGALVAIDPEGQQAKLSLRNYHVDVHIEDGFARTTIDQTYFNHLNSRLEGTFYFPLPADASISRLAMYVNGKLMEGGMAERDHARNVFETIKHRSLDPALLEWIDGSTFKMRVFPLEGRQEKRIVLSYTQRLGNHYGRTDYRFPAGHSMDVVRDWSARLHVVGGEQLRWECSSHALKAATDAGDLTLTFAETDMKPDRDVVLTLLDAPLDNATDAPRLDSAATDDDQTHQRARFSSVVHERARYTMLRFRPKLPVVQRRPRRDWIFLYDADGSRDPLLARVQVDIIKTLLENAEHEDTFSIITAGTRVHTVAPHPWPVTDENIGEAVKSLDQTQLIGALDLDKALTACREVARTLDKPVVVHVGSAIPILGERASDQLLEQLSPETPYVGIGVGKRWNRAFMKAAASRTGGYFTQINPDETTGWRAFELLATLNSPRLLDLDVTTDLEKTEFYNYSDSAADGEELCAIVRQETGQPDIHSVTVTGFLDGAPFRQTIPVEQVEKNASYLPRIWAKLAIDDMIAQGAEANKAEIIELSKAMYVMSPFTSLLVLENDAMYEQYNVDRGRKDHWGLYPCPAEIDVVHEPILGPKPPITAVVISETVPKPSRKEILLTLLIRVQRSGTSDRNGNSVNHHVIWNGSANRLFKGVRSTQSTNDPFGDPFGGIPVDRFTGLLDGADPAPIMLMVTPRIIISEEEEPLGFLREFDGDGLGSAADFDDLIELITSTITPDAWDDVGGPGTIDAIPTQLSLVISQTQSIHEGFEFIPTRVYPVADLVVPLGTVYYESSPITIAFSAERGPRDFLSVDYPTPAVWEALRQRRTKYASVDLGYRAATAEDARFLTILAEQTSFNYRNKPLKDVIDDVALRHDIPIIINTTALEDFGIDALTPVTISLKGVSLRSALRLMLRELHLTFIIIDDVMQITTPEEAETQLITKVYPRSYWCNETLLMIPRRSAAEKMAVTRHHRETSPPTPRPRAQQAVDRLAGHFRKRWENATTPANLLYPAGVGGARKNESRHLATFARGITTTRADALAVLEEEADLGPRPKTGKIDDEARALIESARREGWHHVTRRDDAGRVLWQMTVDGQGRFRYEQQTEYGLTETVVGNGKTLRHLYRELGLGTKRTISRFHRAELAKLVPWHVPPTEDLIIGADIRLIGPRVIAIAPHGIDDAHDGGEPQRYYRVHLEFSETGRLAARHLVEMPAGKTVLRVTYDDGGTVRWFNADHEVQHEFTIASEPTSAPDLKPEVTDLVLLPMPLRSRDHVVKMAAIHSATPAEDSPADALQTIVANDDRVHRDDPAYWSEDDALRLLSTIHGQRSEETRNVIGRRFFAKGDRRLGFYTLLAATGQQWDVDKAVALSDGTATRMSPSADHPNSELARYLERHLRAASLDPRVEEPLNPDAQNQFIAQLSEYQRLCLAWHPVRDLPDDAEARHRQIERAFGFIEHCDSPRFAFTLLRRVQRQLGEDQPHRRIAEVLIKLEARGMTSYVIKYELARSLAAHGQASQAQQLFMELYRDSLDAGVVPPIDSAFRAAVMKRDAKFWADEDSGQNFSGFMRGACADLIQRDQREAAIGLAWQCRQLGEHALAGKLIDQALTGLPDHRRLEVSLAALDYLVQIGDHQRAISLLQPLLTCEPYSQSPELWRLAAHIAHAGGMLARSVNGLERAADLEYANLASVYNVEDVRNTYSQLVARYQELAKIVAADAPDSAPLNLASRVIQAADRWRSLDTDVTAACQQAATLLNELGHDDLAWDYLTTPLATKPNESTGWLSLAQKLREEESIDLADRAYGAAWSAEPTDAKILWEHAQMLEHAGRLEDAQRLYQQLVDGDWQVRFRPIQGRARRILAATEKAATQ